MRLEQEVFLEELYRKYFKQLNIYAATTLNDNSGTKAQDIIQDVFHEAVLHIDILEAHVNPGGWLMQTTKYKICENERAHMRYIRRFLSLDSEAFPEIASVDTNTSMVSEFDYISSMKKIKQALSQDEFYLVSANLKSPKADGIA